MADVNSNNAGDDGRGQDDQSKREAAIRKMAEVNFVVSTIIASVTYAAVLQVPGGYDSNGKANLSKNKDFIRFLSLNSFAFVISLLSMLIHFCVGHVGVGRTYCCLYAWICAISELSLVYLGWAFIFAIRAIWTEELTVLLTWDNKTPIFSFKHHAFENLNGVLAIPTLIFGIFFYIVNKNFLVRNSSPPQV